MIGHGKRPMVLSLVHGDPVRRIKRKKSSIAFPFSVKTSSHYLVVSMIFRAMTINWFCDSSL